MSQVPSGANGSKCACGTLQVARNTPLRSRVLRALDIREVSTQERLASKPAFDLAQLKGSGLYLSASKHPANADARRGEQGA